MVTLDINTIWNNQKKLKSATGLNKEEADELLKDFSIKISEIEKNKKTSGGRPNKLPALNYFLMMMFQLRHHVTFEVLGFMFDLDPSNAKRRFESTEDLVKEILRKKKLSHLIRPKPTKKELENRLTPSQKSLSMALNNLYGDLKIV